MYMYMRKFCMLLFVTSLPLSPFLSPLSPFSLFLGETGIGKSTLMDSLFKEDFKDTPVSHKQPDVKLSHNTYSEFTGIVY